MSIARILSLSRLCCKGGGSSAPAEVVILPETTVGITNMQGYLTTPCSELPKPGSTIVAIYNGVRYECKLGTVYSEDGDGFALGNLEATLGAVGGNNDAPFVIIFFPDGMDTDDDGNADIYGAVMALDGSSEVTISLVKVADPAPGETFRVNVLVRDGEVVSCDSNIGEIKMAFDSGKMPYCVVDKGEAGKTIFSLILIEGFTAEFIYFDGARPRYLYFQHDGTITYREE